jgi:predicted RNA-binding protein
MEYTKQQKIFNTAIEAVKELVNNYKQEKLHVSNKFPYIVKYDSIVIGEVEIVNENTFELQFKSMA